jgi:hypothetical protein
VGSQHSETNSEPSGLEHLTTEELLERLRNANHPPDPNKQTLEEYIREQEQNEDRTDSIGSPSESDR